MADLECSACPVGKQSVEGASRCSSCGRGEVFAPCCFSDFPLDEIFDKDSASCQPCASNFYAFPGFDKCLLRPTCSMTVCRWVGGRPLTALSGLRGEVLRLR